jgi:hypothetical protein
MVARIAGYNRERIILRPSLRFNGVKVFSATMRQQREQLGEAVTAWIAAHSELTIVDITVAQSSDTEFHCVTLVAFYRDPCVAR